MSPSCVPIREGPVMLIRKLAFVLGTVAFSAPALVACGFDSATDRPYTPAAGVNDQTTAVDVLGAVIVSTEPGSGTFVASMSNEVNGEETQLDSIAPASGESIDTPEFEPVTVPPGGLANLAEDGGIEMTGDFEAGDFVELTLGFGSGERVTMSVPVVENSGDYANLDGPAPSESASESASESPSEAGESVTETTEPESSETAVE